MAQSGFYRRSLNPSWYGSVYQRYLMGPFMGLFTGLCTGLFTGLEFGGANHLLGVETIL